MEDYIKQIREKVGHMPLVLSVAGCLILDEHDRVLLQHRTDDHLWSPPGGAVELGETVEDTVRREVFEETGLQLNEFHLFKIYSGESQHHIYPNGDEAYFVNIVYISRDYIGDPTSNDHESKEVSFWDLKHLPDMTDGNKRFLEDLRNYLLGDNK